RRPADSGAADSSRPAATGRRHHRHRCRDRRGNPTTQNLGALEGPRRREGQGMKGKVIQLKRRKTAAPVKSTSALARELNLPRSTVRSRLAKGWQPLAADVERRQEQPKAPSPLSPPPSPPSPPPSPPLAKLHHPVATSRLIGAAILAIAALGVAG